MGCPSSEASGKPPLVIWISLPFSFAEVTAFKWDKERIILGRGCLGTGKEEELKEKRRTEDRRGIV